MKTIGKGVLLFMAGLVVLATAPIWIVGLIGYAAIDLVGEAMRE